MTGGLVTVGPSLDSSPPTMWSLMLKPRYVSASLDGVGDPILSSLENGEKNEAKNISKRALHRIT